MTRELDLADIQGNIIRPYGRIGFPVARHLFFNIGNAAAGRRFIERVRRAVTTAERWAAAYAGNPGARPLVAVNIGISFPGLLALELPPAPSANCRRSSSTAWPSETAFWAMLNGVLRRNGIRSGWPRAKLEAVRCMSASRFALRSRRMARQLTRWMSGRSGCEQPRWNPGASRS